MLPHVHGEQRRLAVAVGDRGVGVVGVDDVHAAVGGFHQPGPAGAEVAGRLGVELFLELIERAELLGDRFTQCTGRLAAAVGAQAVPVEGVVPDLRGLVEQTTLGALDDLFQGFAFVVGPFDQIVELGDVRVVVLTVMILERLFGDVRFKSVFLERKRRKFKSHSQFP